MRGVAAYALAVAVGFVAPVMAEDQKPFFSLDWCGDEGIDGYHFYCDDQEEEEAKAETREILLETLEETLKQLKSKENEMKNRTSELKVIGEPVGGFATRSSGVVKFAWFGSALWNGWIKVSFAIGSRVATSKLLSKPP